MTNPITHDAALEAVAEYLRRYADVNDGDYGVPEPNEAMVLLAEVEAALDLTPATNKIADTFNEYGTPVTMLWCDGCKSTFTVCPAVEDEHLGEWTGCLGETCPSYDPGRDADKLFDEGKVRRRGDRSHIKLVPQSPAGEVK